MNSVHLPPLRERQGDVPVLAYHFLRKFCELNNRKIEIISEPAMKILENYDYPGNIRELMNIINGAVIIESTSEIKKKCLPGYVLESTAPVERRVADGPFKTMEEMEKEYIRKILDAMGGNKTRTTRILGISRIGLLSKIKKYRLD